MQFTPVKKLIICLAALCVAISVMTANTLEAVVIAKASQNVSAFLARNASGGAGNDAPAGTDAGDTGNADAGANNDTNANANTDTGATTPGNSDNGTATGGDEATGGANQSTEQIVDIYKKAINNAKANGKNVVRVKDGAINYKGVVKAGNLSSIAETLMGMFMASDVNAIETKNEPWKASELPPSGVNSNLTVAGVKSANMVEEGNNYIITIVANNAKNPKAGDDGVGSIASVIEEGQITGAIGSVPALELKNISIDYEEVTVKATIDKATGNLIALTTDAPCYLNLDAKVPLLGSIDGACVGIQVISEFTIAY